MKKQLLVASVLAALALQAQAGAMDDGNLSISGFGTLGVAKTNTDQVEFARYNQAEGVQDKARIGLDSNLGLQATYTFNDWLSGTAQVLTRKNTSPTFTTDLTWAFLKAKVNDETSVRVGRIALPGFLISDYQNVGYANTMIRPPVELYAQEPIESSDGVDVNYQHSFGDLNFTAQGFVGVSRGKLFIPTAGGSVATYRAPVSGLAVSGEYGPFVLRFAHLQAKMDTNDLTPINQLVATLSAVGFPDLGNQIAVRDKKIGFNSVGLTMDWKNIVLQTEYAQRRAKDPVYIPDTNAWYTMAGYRIGKVLPYYAHAAYEGHGRSVTFPSRFPTSGALYSTVNSVLTSGEQKSDLIGVRWDFAKSLALKVQVDRVKPTVKTGELNFPKSANVPDVTVVAAAVDFVF